MTAVQQVVIVVVHALACFYHFVWHGAFVRGFSWTEALCLAALLVALVIPTDRRALVALLVAELLDVFWIAPEVPNHWLLTGIFDLFLLGALLADPRDGLRKLRLPAAIGVAIFYFYTGFWKLTDQWFDPAVSCGAKAWYRLAEQFAFLPRDGLGPTLAIYATLVLELVLPLLLIPRRTRGPAILVFVVFHAVLALDAVQNFLNFSSVMWALLLLLYDDEAFERLTPSLPAIRGVARISAALIVGLQLLAAFEATRPTYAAIRWTLALMLHVPLVLYVHGRLALPIGSAGPAARPAPWAWGLPLLILLNGLSPWLGLKTRNSWQMYSNLRLEADASNHLLLPRSLDLFGWLADEVEVLEVGDPELAEEWVRPELRVTWFTFRGALAERPEVSVRYRRGGVERVVPRAGDDPELSRPHPLVLRKLVWFRPLGPEVARVCQW